jgi:hypothetical protein
MYGRAVPILYQFQTPMKLSRFLAIKVLYSFSLLSCTVLPAQPPERAIVPKANKPPEAVKPPEVPVAPLVTWAELNKEIGGPTLVTLQFNATSATEAIEQLRKQSPVPITVQSPQYMEQQKKTITANYQKQPFWSVVRDMCKQLGLRIENYSMSPGVTFTPYGSQEAGVVKNFGPFTFELAGVNYYRNRPYRSAEVKTHESLSMELHGYGDPKIRLMSNGTTYQLIEALDEAGKSLLLPDNENSSSHQTMPIHLSLRLNPAYKFGSQLKKLNGNLHCLVSTNSTTWEIPNVLNAKSEQKTFTRNGQTEIWSFDGVQKEGNWYSVELVVSRPRRLMDNRMRLSNGREIWVQNDNFYQNLRMVDAQGRPLQNNGYNSRGSGDKETEITTITLRYSARNNGDEETGAPDKLILNINSGWRELVVPFQFTNLSLP